MIQNNQFDIQVQASFLSQFNNMATILQYYQTLQLVKYLYTIIHSSHRYYKQPLLFPRDPKAHNTQQPILIELYTDTSFTDSVSQCG